MVDVVVLRVSRGGVVEIMYKNLSLNKKNQYYKSIQNFKISFQLYSRGSPYSILATAQDCMIVVCKF